MKTAILSVGTEILFGQITNTNTVYLSQQLQMLGYDVMYHYTVGDNPTRLKEMILDIFKECDLILTTGGLGPTQDDLTKETVCEALNDKIIEFPEQVEILKSHFEKRGHKMTENNMKQAFFPSRAHIFDNPKGTAPGFALEENGKMVICMPGPPSEMKYMFENRVRPFLAEKQDSVLFYRSIRTFGIGESKLETELLPLIEGQTDPTIATYAKMGESTFRIASKRKTEAEAKAAVDEMLEKAEKIVGSFVYSIDDEELAVVTGKKLIEKKISLACAESITGGSFAGALTQVAGISSVFRGGFVTYTNEMKEKVLGVSKDTLAKYTEYSGETAAEMAQGTFEKTGADICISVTGVAGPDGGTEKCPVGQSYIGISFKSDILKGKKGKEGGNNPFTIFSDHGVLLREEKDGRTMVVKEIQAFGRERNNIRNYTVLAMLSLINSML